MDSSSSSSSSGRDGQDAQQGDPEPVSRPAPLKVGHMLEQEYLGWSESDINFVATVWLRETSAYLYIMVYTSCLLYNLLT